MKKISPFIILLLTTASCNITRHSVLKDDGKISITFVQVNDVYEIAPLANGKEGGMARVATIKKNALQRNPNTFLIIAGDFLSPSVYNNLKYEGKAIRGKQMIEAMNSAGMDYAIFGNHEFDIKEPELQERINESDFQWISSNAFHKVKDTVIPFVKTQNVVNTNFPETLIKTVKDADGTTAKIGFIALTIPFNRASFVTYTDPLSTAKKLYAQIKDSVDAVIAITHQVITDDEILAREIPGLALIIGGHEHDGRFEKIGNIYITKALANAKSAYVINLTINKKNHKIKVDPKLEMVNESIALDSATNGVVQKWQNIASNSYASLGFNAKEVISKKSDPLDARESEIRSHPTNFTRMVIKSIEQAAPKAEVVLMNAGSIRLDDILQAPITQYDIIRSLPYGGGIREVDMKGILLKKIFTQGKNNKGSGGFLLYNDSLQLDNNSNSWILNGKNIDPEKVYRVALADFLLTGGESNLGFLTPSNPDIVKVYKSETSAGSALSDIRIAIINYLKTK
ncbi:MAG: bifunctional metallophosphatase/5'-nucleotidase [Bacteroidota bacterium]|nr:bifunctional metallophosphatase/5'-nucleotidase [Bacteroidota bacterium]